MCHHPTPIPAFILKKVQCFKVRRWFFCNSFRQWSANGRRFDWQPWTLNLSRPEHRFICFREKKGEDTHMRKDTHTLCVRHCAKHLSTAYVFGIQRQKIASMPLGLSSCGSFSWSTLPCADCPQPAFSFRTQIKCCLFPSDVAPLLSGCACVRCQSI